MTLEEKLGRLDSLIARCEQMAIEVLETGFDLRNDLDDKGRDAHFGRAHRLMDVANAFAKAYERATVAVEEAVEED